MRPRCYLDHNATSPLRPEARAAMVAAFDCAGNPSSIHGEGRAARQIVEDARETVAALFEVEPAGGLFHQRRDRGRELAAAAARRRDAGGFRRGASLRSRRPSLWDGKSPLTLSLSPRGERTQNCRRGSFWRPFSPRGEGQDEGDSASTPADLGSFLSSRTGRLTWKRLRPRCLPARLPPCKPRTTRLVSSSRPRRSRKPCIQKARG